jgi:hypothetical protein
MLSMLNNFLITRNPIVSLTPTPTKNYPVTAKILGLAQEKHYIIKLPPTKKQLKSIVTKNGTSSCC